jgi:FHA domain-containing protein
MDGSQMATVDVSYVPGSLTAVAGDQCWALVEVSPDSPAVTRIWQQLGQGAAADALLGGLIADGIGGTAGFTLLVAGTGGQHRLFCRGTVGATVVKAAADGGTSPGEGPAAIERIDGAGLLTWREQVVDGADRIFLGEPPADTALRLPATSGVVLAGSVIIDLTNAAARDTVSYEEKPKKKTIVFFPDTITMTHPGSLADRASAASLAAGQHPPDDRGTVPLPAPLMPFAAAPAGPSAPSGPSAPAGVPGGASGPGHSDGRTGEDGEYEFPWGEPAKTVADGPIRPAGQDDPVSPGRFPPGGAPVTAGYAGTGGQSPAQYPGTPPPATPPWQPVSDGAWPGGPRPGGPMTGPVLPPTPMPAQATNPPGGVPPGGVPPGGLIDAPPWLSGPGGSAPAGQAPLGQAPPGPVPASAGPAEPPYQPPAPRADSRPGESGSTVKRAELPDFVAVTAPPDRIGPVVPALLCPSGHVNPPSGATCRRCGAPLPHDPVPVPRPVLGVLRLSLGDVIMLDRGVLMGRNPRTDFAGTDGEERPHVVKLPSADGDISRTHLRVTLDGWHVLVTDLNSTNGTLVTLPGRDPQQLRPGEPVPIQPGTVVTLADGIDFRYEVTE